MIFCASCGFSGRAEVRAVARRAVGELVGISLTDQDRAGIIQPLGDGRAVVRDVLGEEGGAQRSADAPGVDEVLEGDRNPVQRSLVASGRDLPLGQRRFLERALRRHGDKGVRLVRLDAPEQRAHDLDRGETPLPEFPGEGGERAWQIYVVGHDSFPSPVGACSISYRFAEGSFQFDLLPQGARHPALVGSRTASPCSRRRVSGDACLAPPLRPWRVGRGRRGRRAGSPPGNQGRRS